MKKAITIILSLLLVCSCSSLKWLDEPYAKFPAEEYVCAVGRGDTREEAELNAKRELVSLFGSDVDVETSRTVTETYQDDNGEITEGASEDFSSSTTVTVDVNGLWGLQIAESEETDVDFAALAVLEKKPTVNYYESRLPDMLEEIETLREDLEEQRGTLPSIPTGTVLVEKADEYNFAVGVYNYLTGGKHEFFNVAEIRKLVTDTRNDLSIIITVEGDDSGLVGTNLADILTENGYRIMKEGEDAGITIAVTINWDVFKGIGNPFTFAEYNADTSVIDNATGKIMTVFETHGKEGHQSERGARKRAIKVLSEDLNADLGKALMKEGI